MIAGSKGVSRKKKVHKQTLPLAPFLPGNPSPSHDLVLVLLLQRSAHRSPEGRAQTRLFLIKRVNESTAGTGRAEEAAGPQAAVA